MHKRLIGSAFLLTLSFLVAQEAPRFRTDADGPAVADGGKKKGKDKGTSLEWYQLIDGKFPPAGSAHAISGELMRIDHLERRFHLRVDRNDSQDRGQWDLPLDATMLPYGAVWYHGAPAALQDVPLGTHMHGQFYRRPPGDKAVPPAANNNRKTPEFEFGRCFQLEDDFTLRTRQKQVWKVDSVDLPAKRLVATLHAEGGPIGKPQTFDLLSSTRVFKGNGFGTLASLEKGQSVLFNLTWATLYGPGRVTDVWLDDESRKLATAQQLERHRNHVRERGLPGWVEAVDDEAQVVTIKFFGNVDPGLFDEIGLTPEVPDGAKPEDKARAVRGSVAVARDSLMTYDPVNDRKGGPVLEVKKVPAEPGSAGVRIRVQCDQLLEGFRPNRVVRFYPPTWKVVALPREEQFFGRE